jgi:hypothetical protein
VTWVEAMERIYRAVAALPPEIGSETEQQPGPDDGDEAPPAAPRSADNKSK